MPDAQRTHGIDIADIREHLTTTKNVFFRAFPKKGGGRPLSEFFGPFFYHVLVPKIGIFYPKPLIFVCYLVIFCYHYHQNYHHNYHWTVIIIIGIFLSYAQNVVFDVRKKRYKLPEMGGGGGRGNSGNARKKTFFFL